MSLNLLFIHPFMQSTNPFMSCRNRTWKSWYGGWRTLVWVGSDQSTPPLEPSPTQPTPPSLPRPLHTSSPPTPLRYLSTVRSCISLCLKRIQEPGQINYIILLSSFLTPSLLQRILGIVWLKPTLGTFLLPTLDRYQTGISFLITHPTHHTLTQRVFFNYCLQFPPPPPTTTINEIFHSAMKTRFEEN